MILHRYDTVDSTQRVARELAWTGAPHGTVVLAERQIAGRGRMDRTWSSEPSLDLTFSVILRPGGRLAEAPLLTLGAAAGLAEALDLRVKWPNDIVTAEGRKVAGLLAEVEAAGHEDRVQYVILGVGLNVNRRAFEGLPHATSLALLAGSDLDREAVLARAHMGILAGAEPAGRLDRWRRHAHTIGQHVTIHGTAHGTVSGLATELRDDGALVVDGFAVTTGEIALVGTLGPVAG